MKLNSNDVVGNSCKFRVVKENWNDAFVWNSWNKVLAFESRPNLLGVVFVKNANNKFALLAKNSFKLRRPGFSKKICLEHFIVKNGHIKHFQAVSNEFCELPIFSSKRKCNFEFK